MSTMRESRNPNVTSEAHEGPRLPIRVQSGVFIAYGASGRAVTFTGTEVIFEKPSGPTVVPLAQITGVDFAPATFTHQGHLQVRTTVRRALFDHGHRLVWGGFGRKPINAKATEFVEALTAALGTPPEYVVTRESE